MTPKEALEVLVSNFDLRALKSLSSSDKYWTVFEEFSEAIKTLEKVTQLLKLYERLSYYSKYDTYDKETKERVFELKDDISRLKKELEETK